MKLKGVSQALHGIITLTSHSDIDDCIPLSKEFLLDVFLCFWFFFLLCILQKIRAAELVVCFFMVQLAEI